jgi:hypothetical protein
VSKAEPVRARPPEARYRDMPRAANPDCQPVQGACGAWPEGSGYEPRAAPTEPLTEAQEGRRSPVSEAV